MSNRLDKERQEFLEPRRLDTCKRKLIKLGFEIIGEGRNRLQFIHNNAIVTLYPYSGWHTGKSIKDGRGFENLLKQLKETH